MKQTASRSAILFLARFGGSYIVFSLVYSLFLSNYQPTPDPITWAIGKQLVAILQFISSENAFLHLYNNQVLVNFQGKDVVSIFEGCNGIIVQALFISFFIGIWQWSKKALFFIVLGIVAIYLLIMSRLTALVFTAQSNETLFYYYHKYVFTAVMYLSILGMWYYWLVVAKTKQTK
jgi:exosortase family protein XrtF